MNYQEALAGLKNHSRIFFNDQEDLTAEQRRSLDYALYRLEFHQESVDWQQFHTDILACLQVVHIHLNGENPEYTPAIERRQLLDRDLVIAVSRIIYALFMVMREASMERTKKFDKSVLHDLRRFHFMLSNVWLFMLDGGDFEDVYTEAESNYRVFDSA